MLGKGFKLLVFLFRKKIRAEKIKRPVTSELLSEEHLKRVKKHDFGISIKENMEQPQKGQAKPKEKRDLVIGFDFGTACTKVVIRDPSIRLAHAIPLSDEADSLRKYLLPSEIHFSKKEGFTLQRLARGTNIRYLKLLLMYEMSQQLLGVLLKKFENLQALS